MAEKYHVAERAQWIAQDAIWCSLPISIALSIGGLLGLGQKRTNARVKWIQTHYSHDGKVKMKSGKAVRIDKWQMNSSDRNAKYYTEYRRREKDSTTGSKDGR